MRLTAAIHQEGSGYVARCPEADVASQGETLEEARANLIEAVELHYEGEDLSEIEPSTAIVPIDVDLPTPQRLAG